RLDETVKQWSERYRAGRTDGEPASILNGCLKRLSRILLPIASTAKGSYGHDTFSYTPQGSVIPCLFDTPKLAGLPAAEPQRWMLETQLVRERNRVADALSDAVVLIDSALQRLGQRS